jgi:hemerythrin
MVVIILQSMLKWKSDYETGLVAIDTQHKVLFDNINRLEKLLEQDEIDQPEANQLLLFLEDYAKQHFNSEEICMARFRCPAYTRNKEDHALFLNLLESYKVKSKAVSTSRVMLQRLCDSMIWWINLHILKVDKQLKDFGTL